MKVTKVEEQGLRLALALARGQGRGTLAELARGERLSIALAAKILAKLRRGGVIRAVRGRHGHYELNAEPATISVARVLRSLETSLVRGCFNSRPCIDQEICPHGQDCSLRPVWRHLEHQVAGVLDQLSLADLLQDEGEVRRQVVGLWPRVNAEPDNTPSEPPASGEPPMPDKPSEVQLREGAEERRRKPA
jgi:Rrf2 family protein